MGERVSHFRITVYALNIREGGLPPRAVQLAGRGVSCRYRRAEQGHEPHAGVQDVRQARKLRSTADERIAGVGRSATYTSD